MILGIVSDTHGNHALMHRIARQLVQRHQARVLLHLGDFYDDGQLLSLSGYDVRVVPGLTCIEYSLPHIPRTRVECFQGLTLAMAHTPELVSKHRNQAHVLLHGHTHIPQIVDDGSNIWINPGHLKAPRDRGQPATFATLQIQRSGEAAVAIYGVDGDLLREYTFSFTPSGDTGK